MSERLVDGQVYGVKRIIRYVCNLGKKELYLTECINCKGTRTSPRDVIEKEQGCRFCYSKTFKAFSPRRLAQLKRDAKNA